MPLHTPMRYEAVLAFSLTNATTSGSFCVSGAIIGTARTSSFFGHSAKVVFGRVHQLG